MEKDTLNWTVIYDNGWEEVRVKATEDNALYCILCDGAGPLEELSWPSKTKVRDIRHWLNNHSIDATTFHESSNTGLWETLMSKCSNANVNKLVNISRKTGKLTF